MIIRHAEAQARIAAEIAHQRTISYERHVAGVEETGPLYRPFTDAAGDKIWIETEYHWDDPFETRDVRVIVLGLRTLNDGVVQVGESDGFIIAPDGSFVGE